LHDGSGKLAGYVKILRDNTERKMTEEALHRAKRAAEAASEAKDQFLANVSHELRTPLSAIVLWASLIEDQKVHDPEQLNEAIRAIRKSAEEQRELIEDLVDNARIVAGKLRLEPKLIDLTAVVREGVETGRSLAAEKKVTLEQTCDPDIDSVMADGSRIKQVVSNLINNAIKFTPSGGRVHLKLRRLQDEVQIIVSDTGVGLSREFVANAFDRFTQMEQASTRTQKGLGLGLAISRQIVELHGGNISVDSPGAGRGCTFTVRLPMPALHAEDVPRVAGSQPQLAGLLKDRRILLIEDVAATRRALTAVLEEAGAQVDAVDSAPAASEKYERQRPDVIVSDLGLPTIDGYAFIRQIRETEEHLKTDRTLAVALAAFADESVNRRVLDSGFQACLTKPVEPMNLVTTLASLLNAAPSPRDQL
jgi:CheY-like chemotaxis protein